MIPIKSTFNRFFYPSLFSVVVDCMFIYPTYTCNATFHDLQIQEDSVSVATQLILFIREAHANRGTYLRTQSLK